MPGRGVEVGGRGVEVGGRGVEVGGEGGGGGGGGGWRWGGVGRFGLCDNKFYLISYKFLWFSCNSPSLTINFQRSPLNIFFSDNLFLFVPPRKR